MLDASSALRKAIYTCLIGDAALITLLGGARVYDEVPRGEQAPYVAIVEGNLKDWSTNLDRGYEHFIAISAWSKQGGAREACAIIGAVQAALDAMPATLGGHHLVNLTMVGIDVKREANTRLVRAILRLRAVTEVM